MISLFFNQTFWLVVLAVVLLVIAVVICTKYEIARYIVLGVFSIGLIVSSVFAGHYLRTYYTANGGIFGYIDGIVVKNELVKNDEASFNLTNINFSATSNDNEFVAIYKTTDSIVELDNSSNYRVSVNGNDTFIDLIGSDYINGRFVYSFYSRNNTLMFTDELKFNISCYKNYTQLQIFTTGGSEAVKYWNSYFAKNGITFNIEKIDKIEKTVLVLEEVDSTSDFVLVKVYDDKDNFTTLVYKNGSSISLKSYSDIFFNGYEIKSKKSNGYSVARVDNSYTFNQDTDVVIKPKFDKVPSDSEYVAEMILRQEDSDVLDLTIFGQNTIKTLPTNSIVNKNYLNIIFPSSLDIIKSHAIVGCNNLAIQSGYILNIPSVSVIEENAFYNCSSSMNIKLSQSFRCQCPDTYDLSLFNYNILYSDYNFNGLSFKSDDKMYFLLFNCKNSEYDLPYRSFVAEYDYTFAETVYSGGFSPYSTNQYQFIHSTNGANNQLIIGYDSSSGDFTSLVFDVDFDNNTIILTSSDGSIVLKYSFNNPELEINR